MCNRSTAEKVAIVTTSWDDAQPLDVRLAEMLGSYGLRGTFYIPLKYDGHTVMNTHEIRSIKKMEMEIGSHTVTHSVLTKLSSESVLREVTESKKLLEDMLGEPVLSFSYPEGRFNKMVRSQVVEAGYTLARTTVSFRIESNFDPFCMPVSFQFFPRTRTVHIRHTLKEGNLKGIMNWFRFCKMEVDTVKLLDMLFDYVLKYGGIFHIWGHSWEIEKFGLWGLLEEVLKRIANRQGVLYLTNSQALGMVNQ